MKTKSSVVMLLLAAILLSACPGPGSATPTSPAPTGAAATVAPPVTAQPSATPDQSVEATAPATVASTGKTLTVMTHDSFSVSEAVVAEFQSQCGCAVQFLKSGDAGQALNKAILSKGNPLADVFYGVDNTFMSRALASDIFEPYASPALAGIPDDLKLDPGQQPLARRLRLCDHQL